MPAEDPMIARHKAAIRRAEPSLPVKCLIRDGLLEQSASFFDYGCGHGEDFRSVARHGIESAGWDPAFQPDAPRNPADAVNLGFVLNVIEDPHERSETLRHAWSLSNKVLSVAGRILVGDINGEFTTFGDGVLTRIGTFQKFYIQSELRQYIESVLGTDAFAAAPGVFYVFRDEELRDRFLAMRYRRRGRTPRKRISEIRFEQHRELLESLMEWISDRGRLPENDEFPNAPAVIDEFGSIKRAFSLIRRITGTEWEAVKQRHCEDLLVYLALTRFRCRPRFSSLPLGLQRDLRAFFGSYKCGCERADELLFRAGEADAIDAACQQSQIGLLQENSLWLHRSAVEDLDPLLRIYEGCARAYIGEMEDANIVKLHRLSGKVSYFACPDFERDAHPALIWCVKLSLRSRDVEWFDSSQNPDPLVLHSKERFVSTGFPGREKFSKLTAQEEKRGLLNGQCRCRRRSEWLADLATYSVQLNGHRLIRRQP